MYDALLRSTELYEDDFIEVAAEMRWITDLLFGLYILFVSCLVLFIYMPMISRLRRDAKNAWEMLNLIP